MDIYEEIKKAAEAVHRLYDSDYVINISGIGTPTVLMTGKGFDEFFPDAEQTLYQGDTGETWGKREVERDGIIFQSFREYVRL